MRPTPNVASRREARTVSRVKIHRLTAPSKSTLLALLSLNMQRATWVGAS